MNIIAATSARSQAFPSLLWKVLMAVTGMLMAGWLTLHMLGNLLVFAGPALHNAYAEKLRDSGLLWPMRLIILSAIGVHVLAAGATTLRAHAARRIGYRARQKHIGSTLASRTMRVTGVLLLIYIAYHVANMYGVGHPSFRTGDVYHNLVVPLRNPWHAVAYVSISALTALHLAHGLTSAWVSLGWSRGITQTRLRRVMQAWAAMVTLGFAAETIAIGLHWV
jgi:succinate dehydrogenase / fumarate reductase cytochrome b subunit